MYVYHFMGLVGVGAFHFIERSSEICIAIWVLFLLPFHVDTCRRRWPGQTSEAAIPASVGTTGHRGSVKDDAHDAEFCCSCL